MVQEERRLPSSSYRINYNLVGMDVVEQTNSAWTESFGNVKMAGTADAHLAFGNIC